MIERRKTKTKETTTASQNKGKYDKKSMRTQIRCKRPEARENASDQVAIGFSFASDWFKGWYEFSTPIKERSKEKAMHSRITFETQLKIAPLTKQVRIHVLKIHKSNRRVKNRNRLITNSILVRRLQIVLRMEALLVAFFEIVLFL